MEKSKQKKGKGGGHFGWELLIMLLGMGLFLPPRKVRAESSRNQAECTFIYKCIGLLLK